MHTTKLSPIHFGRWLAVLILLLGLSALTVSANITLSTFKATVQSDGSILVIWETATEFNTQGFSLYRTTTTSAPWNDQPITQVEARGDGFTGASYQYLDRNTVSGTVYYYWLQELTSGGVGDRVGPVEALLPGAPTSTPSATSPAPGATISPTAPAPPTATQQFTNTPAPPATATAAPATAVPSPTVTPLPQAVVATPTGMAPAPTLFVPADSPTPAPSTATPEPAATAAPVSTPEAAAPTFTPTAASVAQADPDVTRTPLVFLATAVAQEPTPVAAPTATPDTGRNPQRLLLLGGGAIGLAAVLAAAVVFAVRARR